MSAARPAGDGGDLRARIIAQATRLFAEKGFSATSVRQVAEACGCTKPSLYYYFDSKETLFRQVVELHIDELSSMARRWVTSGGSARTLTHRAVDAFIDHAAANPQVMRLLQRVETRSEDGAPAFNVLATRELHLELISAVIARGIAAGHIRAEVAPLDCALVIAGTLSFQFEMSLVTGRWERDRIHRTIDLIFDGIAI